MVIYADVLVSINILITYVFLVCVRVITNSPTAKWSVASASLLGGLFSLVILLDDIGNLFSISIKFISCLVIVLVAFRTKSIRQILRQLICFVGLNGLFGGVVFFLEITFKPPNILFYNGVVYFDMSVPYIVAVTLVVYGLFLLFEYFLMRSVSKKELFWVDIQFREVEVTLRGFVDTGNNMRDGLSGNAVFVTAISSLLPLFSSGEREFFSSDTVSVPPESIAHVYRLLPCSTIAGNGILPGIIPDRVVVRNSKSYTEIKGVTLGIIKEKTLSSDYDILLSKCIFDNQWKELSDDKKSLSLLRTYKK